MIDVDRLVVIGGALGVAVLAAQMNQVREPEGIPVAHAPLPGWYQSFRADIQRKWPPATDASGAAYAQLKMLRAHYGTVVYEGSDVSRAPIGELAYWASAWANVLEQIPASAGQSGAIQRWRGVRDRLVQAAQASDIEVVSVAHAALYQRELAVLVTSLDEVEDRFAPVDDRGYTDFFAVRWHSAVDAVEGAVESVVTFGVGSVAWPAVKGVVSALGAPLFIGGVAYYVYKKWPS